MQCQTLSCHLTDAAHNQSAASAIRLGMKCLLATKVYKSLSLPQICAAEQSPGSDLWQHIFRLLLRLMMLQACRVLILHSFALIIETRAAANSVIQLLLITWQAFYLPISRLI